ncbi:MAG: hypothetical protein LBG04_00080 [Holosporaceae bacterium]|jgi:hypothetical protein|nr:hypothetical protein [Holosporaceae bacterium]
MCQADPIEEVRGLQNKIDNGVHRVEIQKLLTEMISVASSASETEPFLENIFSGIQDNDDKKAIKLNTLLLLAFPDRCLGVTQLVKEIKDIKNVNRVDIGRLLFRIMEYLELNDDSDSPIVELYKRYK